MASRSPNYPTAGLDTAIEGVKKIWSKEKRSPFPPTVAAEHLGFGSLNGTSRGRLAALKQYGLLKDIDNSTLTLTPLAIKIMAHPEGSAERLSAIREAALTPKFFRELRDTYPEASDGTLQAYLITQKEFGADGAKKAIKSYRDTLRLARLDQEDYTQADDTLGPEDIPTSQRESSSEAPLRSLDQDEFSRAFPSKQRPSGLAIYGRAGSGSSKELRVNISRDTEALIVFNGPVTQEGIEKLAALLDLQKDTFPTKTELQAVDTQAADNTTANEDSPE